jgi:hypothetical protein
MSPGWRFYDGLSPDLPSGVQVPASIAEGAAAIVARRWALSEAQAELRQRQADLEVAQAHDAALEAECAYQGTDAPKPSAPRAAAAVERQQRLVDAHAAAAKQSVREWLDQVWAARQRGWQGELAEQLEQQDSQLLEDVRQLGASWDRREVLAGLVRSLDELESTGGNLAGWALTPPPEAIAERARRREQLIEKALLPPDIGYRSPPPAEESLAALAALLAPPAPIERVAHPADSPQYGESVIAAIAHHASLLNRG